MDAVKYSKSGRVKKVKFVVDCVGIHLLFTEANERLMSRIRALAVADGGWRFRITGDMSCSLRFRLEEPNGGPSTSGDVFYPPWGDYPLYEPSTRAAQSQPNAITVDEYQFWKTTYSSAIVSPDNSNSDVVQQLYKELALDHNGFPDDASRLPSF